MCKPTEVRIVGPLAPYAGGFCAELSAQGYTPLSAANQMRLMAHLSRWLDSRRIPSGKLSPDRVQQFLKARRRAGYTAWLSERGLAPLLGHLRQAGVVPKAVRPEPVTELDLLLERYGDYMVRERGLATTTIRRRKEVALRFLSVNLDPKALDLHGLQAAYVTRFVLQECRGRHVGTAQLFASELRSLLRFLYLEGLTPTQLAGAVPPVAGWRHASLPRFLEPKQIQEILSSCDRRTAVGRRDYAILLLLSRLGLRAGEVTTLQLQDIDWVHGEIEIRGKGNRQDRLPLPQDVGEAIVAYLCRGRPRSACRHLFLCSRAPHGPLGRTSVAVLVYGACTRAGVPRVNPHRLRHTAATQMLRQGGTLPEISQVLRHRSLGTTAIYAKVDRKALRVLALPWPGAKP